MRFSTGATFLATLVTLPAAALGALPMPAIEWTTKLGDVGPIRMTYFSSIDSSLFVVQDSQAEAVHQVNPETGEALFSFAPSEPYTSVSQDVGVYETAEGVQLLVVVSEGKYAAFDPGTQSERWSVDTSEGNSGTTVLGKPAFSKDGNLVYVCRDFGPIQAVNTESGSILWEAYPLQTACAGLDMSPNRAKLYMSTQAKDGMGSAGIHAISTTDGSVVDGYNGGGDVVMGPVTSSDGSSVYAIHRSAGLSKYDASDLAKGPLWTVALSPNTLELANVRPTLSSDDSTIYSSAFATFARVDADSGDATWAEDIATTLVAEAVLSPEEDYIYLNAGARILKVSTATGETEWEFRASIFTSEMSLNADGSLLYAGSSLGDLYAIKTETPENITSGASLSFHFPLASMALALIFPVFLW